MSPRRCCCWSPWETLFRVGGLRVQRNGWTLRLRSEEPDVDVRMDYMTRRLQGWYGETLAGVIPDHTRSILAVGMNCAALPAWVAEWLPQCTRVVAVDVTPLLRYVSRRYFFSSPPSGSADLIRLQYVNGTVRDYLRRLPLIDSFDVVLIEHNHDVGDVFPALAGIVTRRGRIVVASNCACAKCRPTVLFALMNAYCGHVTVHTQNLKGERSAYVFVGTFLSSQ